MTSTPRHGKDAADAAMAQRIEDHANGRHTTTRPVAGTCPACDFNITVCVECHQPITDRQSIVTVGDTYTVRHTDAAHRDMN